MIEGHSERPKRGTGADGENIMMMFVTEYIYPGYCEHLVDREGPPLGLFSRTPAAMLSRSFSVGRKEPI